MNDWVVALLVIGALTCCVLLARYVQPRVIAWELRKRDKKRAAREASHDSDIG